MNICVRPAIGKPPHCGHDDCDAAHEAAYLVTCGECHETYDKSDDARHDCSLEPFSHDAQEIGVLRASRAMHRLKIDRLTRENERLQAINHELVRRCEAAAKITTDEMVYDLLDNVLWKIRKSLDENDLPDRTVFEMWDEAERIQ